MSAHRSVDALLDTVVETLNSLARAGDRRAEYRKAQASMDELISRVRSNPDLVPPGFQSRLQEAHRCLRMGKPMECVAQLRALRAMKG